MCIMFDDTPTVLYCTNLAVGMNVLRRGFKLTAALTAGTTATAWLVYRRERSAVPAGSELVRAKSAPPQTTHLKRLATDNLMGGFDAYYLAATWFYDKPLDAAAIKATLEAAVTAMPALAGRRTSDGIVLSNKGARFSVCEEHAGSARDWARADDEVVAAPGVRSFVDTPSSCSGGEQPLFTVRVTNFADGTSAIGIAAPHSLMDGQSYMSVVVVGSGNSEAPPAAIAGATIGGGVPPERPTTPSVRNWFERRADAAAPSPAAAAAATTGDTVPAEKKAKPSTVTIFNKHTQQDVITYPSKHTVEDPAWVVITEPASKGKATRYLCVRCWKSFSGSVARVVSHGLRISGEQVAVCAYSPTDRHAARSHQHTPPHVDATLAPTPRGPASMRCGRIEPSPSRSTRRSHRPHTDPRPRGRTHRAVRISRSSTPRANTRGCGPLIKAAGAARGWAVGFTCVRGPRGSAHTQRRPMSARRAPAHARQDVRGGNRETQTTTPVLAREWQEYRKGEGWRRVRWAVVSRKRLQRLQSHEVASHVAI